MSRSERSAAILAASPATAATTAAAATVTAARTEWRLRTEALRTLVQPGEHDFVTLFHAIANLGKRAVAAAGLNLRRRGRVLPVLLRQQCHCSAPFAHFD